MTQNSHAKLIRRVKGFALFLLVVLMVRVFLFQIYVVSGNSMAPSLRNGDIVFVSKMGFPVKTEILPWEFIYTEPELNRLDIVLFENQENEISLKRVVGVPHEYYEINHGKVMIESSVLEENYVPTGAETSEPSNQFLYRFPNSPFLEMEKKGRIPPKYFLLLGDNREYSTDSRSIGLVPLEKMRGKVIASIP